MPTDKCLVSVLIPVFNSAPTLWRAAQSVLRQRVASLELLIIDDGSGDSSLGEARRIAALDPRVRVIALPTNHGKSYAMNRAIELARGTWIALLDADDCYVEDRLDTLIDAAEGNAVDLVADNQYFHDAGAGQVVRTAFPIERGDGPLTRQDFIACSDALAEFNYGMLKPVISADFVRRTGLRYRESARLSEDFLYLAEFFAAGGRAFLVAQPMYYWTQAFGTLSRRWTDTGAGHWRYDFLSALAANAEVRNRLHRENDKDLIALLGRRDSALRRLHLLGEVDRLRSVGGRLSELAHSIMRHPSIWPLVLQRAVRAACRLAAARGRSRPQSRSGVDSAVT